MEKEAYERETLKKESKALRLQQEEEDREEK
jgi:hypothetical protein